VCVPRFLSLRTKMAKAMLATCLFVSAAVVLGQKQYNPDMPTDPMDDAARAIDAIIKGQMVVPRKADNWQNDFCDCVSNGNIAGWYQYASSLYLVETCNIKEGFVLRTGHIQDRHFHPMQAMMTCDVLKLVSYCLSHKAPEAIPMWNQTCREAHYTVPACDANCNAAVPRASGRLGAMAAVAVAVVGAATTLFDA
ncbi:unnamed protein product, partial [Polarella glacialis]